MALVPGRHDRRGRLAPWWALLAEFGPLAAIAVLGVGSTRTDADLMLQLWVLACGVVFLILPESHAHALSGLTLPLSILAIRGWPVAIRRLGLRRRPAATLAVALILAGTVPAAIDHIQAADQYHSNLTASSQQLLFLTPDQSAALNYLDVARTGRPILQRGAP